MNMVSDLTKHALDAYGHCIPLNSSVTHTEFASLIERNYDIGEPHNRAVYQQVMLDRGLMFGHYHRDMGITRMVLKVRRPLTGPRSLTLGEVHQIKEWNVGLSPTCSNQEWRIEPHADHGWAYLLQRADDGAWVRTEVQKVLRTD